MFVTLPVTITEQGSGLWYLAPDFGTINRNDAVSYSPKAGCYVSSQPDKGYLNEYPYPCEQDFIILKNFTMINEDKKEKDAVIASATEPADTG